MRQIVLKTEISDLRKPGVRSLGRSKDKVRTRTSFARSHRGSSFNLHIIPNKLNCRRCRVAVAGKHPAKKKMKDWGGTMLEFLETLDSVLVVLVDHGDFCWV